MVICRLKKNDILNCVAKNNHFSVISLHKQQSIYFIDFNQMFKFQKKYYPTLGLGLNISLILISLSFPLNINNYEYKSIYSLSSLDGKISGISDQTSVRSNQTYTQSCGQHTLTII